MKEYAFYKGDELLAIGTMEEIAEQVGITKASVYFYGTKSYQKRKRKKENLRRTLLLLDDEE